EFMKSALRKNNLREIRKSVGRYFAIAAIVCIGVGFLAGLSVTRESMLDTANDYTDRTQMYDYKLISTLGLTDEDIEAFAALDGVRVAEGSYSADFLCERGESDFVLSVYSLGEKVNVPDVLYGRMPSAANECLADSLIFDAEDLGRTLKLSDLNSEETFDNFTYKEYTIVGIANSPLHINRMRPSSKLGNGTSSGYLLIPQEGFSMECYTEAYIKLDGDEEIFSEEYDALSEAYEDTVTVSLEKRADLRYNTLYSDADAEIADAEQEVRDAENDLADAKAELERHRQELADAEAEYADGVQALSDAEAEIADAKVQLANGEEEYQSNLEEYNCSREEAYGALNETKANLEALGALVSAGMATPEQSAQYAYGMTAYEAAKTEADAQFAQVQSSLNEAARILEESRVKIADGEIEIADNRQKLADAEAEIADGRTAIADGEAKLADAETELADAKAEIADARSQLAELEKPSTFVLTRDANTGYANLENDSAIVDGIAKVFPIFFFAVAALVCSTTMARMVSDQRTEIGTLKALGCSNFCVTWKYVLYSGSAALIGCVIGFLGGSWLFPRVIWAAYKMLYCYSETINFVLNLPLAVISLAVSLLCSVGSTILSARNELREMPASLIRPRAPQAGKRILLERIPWLWKRFRFLHKVSLRNIFRYKKRLFMMILGIGGCTALILTGFGVGDSIKNIIAFQYEEILKYDFSISLTESADEENIRQFREDTADIFEETVFLSTTTADLHTNNGVNSLTLTVTSDTAITDLVDLHLDGQTIPYPKTGETVINEKLADLGGYSVGDTIDIYLSETEIVRAKISGICENYVSNFAYITTETYEGSLGHAPEFKTVYARGNGAEVHQIAAQIMNLDGIVNVQIVEDTKNMVHDMMQSMNLVVLLVIACAAALAFVVLYNLSNINITERVREIATLKVLGFYPGEVSSYVFRENLVLTFIGALLGLPAGVALHSFVMSQININLVSFDVRIVPLSFVFAFALTLLFTVLVDFFMRGKLNKINMAESLKSIE
ncbi:MAG: FtsX-like permease family protein, partial [Eubacteriales bacterium]